MKFSLLIMLVLGLNACGDIKGDTYTDNAVDNSIDESVTYGEGDVLDCSDGNCTLASPYTDEADADAVVGVYNPDYTQAECNAAGFFFCTAEGLCLDQSLDGGTCG